MKIKNTLIVILIFSTISISLTQPNRTYKPFEFENFQPVWQHVVIDTSIIGNFDYFSSIYEDSIYYDGFSHFHGFDPHIVNPVIKDEKIIITELMGGNIKCQGAFIQCLDMESGEIIWQNLYDLRIENRNEYPERAFINKSGQFEILGHRRDASYPVVFYWLNSLMSVRKYNIETGELENRTIIKEDDTQTKKMIIPFTLFGSNIGGSYLYPYKNDYQYFIQNNIVYKNYILDTTSYVLDSNYTNFINEPKLAKNRTFLTEDDRFIQLQYASSRYFYGDIDTFRLYYSLYDRNFNLLFNSRFDDKIKHCYNYHFSYTDKEYFILAGENYDPFKEDTLKYISYSMFNKNAELVEEFTLKNIDGSPFSFYHISYFGKSLKLINEPGMLIVASSKKEDGFNYLVFFKSSGNGDYEVLKEIKVTGQNHQIYPIDLMYIQGEDILLKALDINLDLDDDLYQGFATVYIRLGAENLGLKTITEEYIQNKSFYIYPNPVLNNLIIEFKESFSGNIQLSDELGRIMMNLDLNNRMNINLDVSNFPKGVYFISVKDNNFHKKYKTSTFVKE